MLTLWPEAPVPIAWDSVAVVPLAFTPVIVVPPWMPAPDPVIGRPMSAVLNEPRAAVTVVPLLVVLAPVTARVAPVIVAVTALLDVAVAAFEITARLGLRTAVTMVLIGMSALPVSEIGCPTSATEKLPPV